MALSGRRINSGKPYTDALLTTAAQEFELGTLWAPNNDPGGRKYRYAKNGAVALAAGKLVQGAVVDTNHQNFTGGAGTVAAAGTKLVTIGVAITGALTADQYRGGSITFSNDTGEGQIFPIVNHTNTTTPDITLGETITVAGDTGTEFTLTPNVYRGTLILPTTVTAMVGGIPRIVIPASEYYWAQTAGVACGLVDTGGTVPVGELYGVQAGGPTVAGAMGITTGIEQIIGSALEVGIATNYCAVNLMLDR